METPDVLIVGGGPAGSATALFLAQRAPALAARTLLLEKQRHPRHKVCAGGLIPHTLECLRELDVPLAVPHASVDEALVDVPGARVRHVEPGLAVVVRRHEFDASLAAAARERGVTVREEEKVLDVVLEGGRLRILTSGGEIRPRVVIGADGSGSRVRRALFGEPAGPVARAVMCDVEAAAVGWRGVEERRYVFDFLAVPKGLRGYVWEFPCWIDGRPHVNLGAYALDRGGAVSLPALVRAHAASLGAESIRLEAFPIRLYDPRAPIAGESAILVGDAAGCDPLMGEGISCAFEYARLAAARVAGGFADGRFDLAPFTDDVRGSWFGRKLRRLGLAARVFYGPLWRPAFALAARSRRLQRIGIRWYNGVDDWDRVSGWRLVGRLLAGSPAS